MSCGRRQAASYPARLRLVGWAAPRGAAHVVCRGYPGSCPPQRKRCGICVVHPEVDDDIVEQGPLVGDGREKGSGSRSVGPSARVGPRGKEWDDRCFGRCGYGPRRKGEEGEVGRRRAVTVGRGEEWRENEPEVPFPFMHFLFISINKLSTN